MPFKARGSGNYTSPRNNNEVFYYYYYMSCMDYSDAITQLRGHFAKSTTKLLHSSMQTSADCPSAQRQVLCSVEASYWEIRSITRPHCIFIFIHQNISNSITFARRSCCSNTCTNVLSSASVVPGSLCDGILIHTYIGLHILFAIKANPYQKDTELLERVQHRFTRMIEGFSSFPCAERLLRLGLWTLEERINRCDLREVFKMFL